MKVDYDSEIDALYVRFAPGTVVESEEISDGVVLDYDAAGKIIALEVLGAKERMAPGALPLEFVK